MRAIDRPFLMPIEGVHTIEGRGTVATGKVEQGVIAAGHEGRDPRPGRRAGDGRAPASRQFNRPLDAGEAGQNVGLLLRGVKADQIQRGQVIAAPRSISPADEVPGRGLRAGQGRGRAAHAVLQRLQAAVLLPHDERHRRVSLPEGVEMVMPGDHTPLDVSLDKPVALEAGSRFAIREGGKTVGSGVVTEVIDRTRHEAANRESPGTRLLALSPQELEHRLGRCVVGLRRVPG